MHIHVSILLLLCCFLAFSSFGQIKEGPAIDSLFADWDQPNTPGCALGIFQDGQIIYAKGYGLANLEYDLPNTPSSVFRIASTSKQFTAACIVLLAEQGKLGLDNSLKQHFPDFPDYAQDITIKHLLNHTSGIRDYLSVSYLKGLRDDDFYTDEEVMQWLVNQTSLNFKPGDEFLYSNSGYWLLGQIVKKVSGLNMAEFAAQEIFKPLKMTNTHFHNDHTQIVKNRATGYLPSPDGSYQISRTTLEMIGDGGIFTTVEDSKKWDDAFYDSKVLSRQFWKMMTEPGVLNNGDTLDYGAGLFISEYKGLKTISHGGAFVGFRAELLRFPDQKLSIVLFANRGDANPEQRTQLVADILLKDQFKEEIKENEPKKVKKKQKFISLKTEELEKFAGYYWNEAGAYSRKLYVKADTLRYFRSERSESDLVPVSKNEFKMINVGADVLVRFEKNEAGKNKMLFRVNGGEAIISQQYEPKEYTQEELATFQGEYYSQELDVNYSLKMEAGALMLYVNKRKTSPLESIKKDFFTSDYGIFQFDTDAGRATSFELTAGRVKNLVFEKK